MTQALDTKALSRQSVRQGWKQDPEGVKADILAVALEEFSRNGLSGARMDEISAKTRTSKRMIYYYFGDKDGLYQRVLEEAYSEVRKGEEELLLGHLPAREALRQLAEFTFDHHSRNPDFIRLVMIENIHHGDYLRHSGVIRNLNKAAIEQVETIYRRGVAEGVFREGLSPLAIHWQISALSFFNVSNRASFSLIFGDELFTGDGQALLRHQVSDAVLRLVLR
ncbi:MAG: TetR family transcriptional regulator [Notoacmeibacter sp.]|nr:TetR family transcriptional regulator [Notoacmeibacter sp.]